MDFLIMLEFQFGLQRLKGVINLIFCDVEFLMRKLVVIQGIFLNFNVPATIFQVLEKFQI
jgi:hypothetical protein